MKKAQWKQDPRERAFGKDARDVLNAKLSAYVQELEEKIAYLKQRMHAQEANWDAQRESFLGRIQRLQPQAQAYNFLRQTGVVLADDQEFKHLKGEDMDAFFGMAPAPKVSQYLWQKALLGQQQVEQEINAEFEKAFHEYMLTGTGATKWPQPQK